MRAEANNSSMETWLKKQQHRTSDPKLAVSMHKSDLVTALFKESRPVDFAIPNMSCENVGVVSGFADGTVCCLTYDLK